MSFFCRYHWKEIENFSLESRLSIRILSGSRLEFPICFFLSDILYWISIDFLRQMPGSTRVPFWSLFLSQCYCFHLHFIKLHESRAMIFYLGIRGLDAFHSGMITKGLRKYGEKLGKLYSIIFYIDNFKERRKLGPQRC